MVERTRARHVGSLGLAALVVGALGWSTNLFGVALHEQWFYGLAPRALAPSGACLVLFCASFCFIALALETRESPSRSIPALVLPSLTLQWANILVVDGTLTTQLTRFTGGHGEFFALAAAHREDWLVVLREYERFIDARALGAFAPSKPPGILLIHFALDALGRGAELASTGGPIAVAVTSVPSLTPQADAVVAGIVVFPLTTALTVIPIERLATSLGIGRLPAVGAAILWLTCPVVVAIDLHTDGAVFPLLVVGASACIAKGGRDHLLWAALGGALFALAAYGNFSVLTALPWLGGVLWIAARKRTRVLKASAAGALGAFAMQGILATLLGYTDVPTRMHRALNHHRVWKRFAIGGLEYGGVGLAEFTAYVGPVLVGLVFLAARERPQPWRRPISCLPAFAAGFFVLLAYVNGSNEVARIWLFLVPFVALVAASALPRRSVWPVGSLALIQVGLLLLMRAHQPW